MAINFYKESTLSAVFTLEQIMKSLYSFFSLGGGRGGWLRPRPGRSTPGKETQYALCGRLGGSQGRPAVCRSLTKCTAINTSSVRSQMRLGPTKFGILHLTYVFLFARLVHVPWSRKHQVNTKRRYLYTHQLNGVTYQKTTRAFLVTSDRTLHLTQYNRYQLKIVC